MAKMLKNTNFSENKRKYNVEKELNEDKQKNKYNRDDDDADDDDADDDDADDDDADEDDADDDDADEDDDEDDSDEDDDSDDDDDDSEYAEDEEPLLISSLLSTPVVPVGEYDAVIVDLAIEQRDGKYGIFHFLDVYLEIVTKKATFKVKDRMTGNLNEGTKLSKLMLALIGRVPKADYNLRKILGKEVGVRITHRKDEKGRVWPDVEYIE